MKRKTIWMGFIFLVLTGTLLAGCSQTSAPKASGDQQSENPPVTASQNLLNANWSSIEKQAKGETVNLYMWGGSDTTNNYIDDWVAPRLKKETGVTLKRIPVNDTQDIINKLLADKQAGKKNGSVDIMWINGENFKQAKDHSLLWGSFASKLPNVQKYVDSKAPDIANDFGLPTDGMEAPWGKAQFVFVYDSDKVKNPPKSMKALLAWAKENPGKFTYPTPPDFTGSAFIRQVIYETSGGYQPFMKLNLDENTLNTMTKPAWTYLNELKPYLWRKGETYPESGAKLDQLYGSGEVWMTMSYDPSSAASQVKKGLFPKSTRTFVLNQGTLSNTHYLAIPYNSVHQAAAMVAINFLLSPDAQIAKADPANWGDDTALDPKKLPKADQKRLAAINRGEATLPTSVLASHRVPETPSAYVSVFEKEWTQNVAKK